MTEQFDSGALRIIFRVNFHKRSFCLMIVGKHAWLLEEEEKGDIHLQDWTDIRVSTDPAFHLG